MKKWLCILITISFLFSVNELYAKDLRLGIMGGVNIERTSGDVLSENFEGTFLGGAYIGLGGQRLKIQADFLFSKNTITTGRDFKTAFNDYLTENGKKLKNGTFQMNELSIPIAIGINIIPKFLWFEIGPQYTAIVSIKDEDDFLKESKRVFKTGYVSGILGLYIELPLHLNLGVRYIAGITDRNNSTVNDTWKTDKLQLRLGLSILK